MSFSELLVVILVAFLVIKPKELPAIIRSIGRFIYYFKHFSDSAKKTLEDQLKLEELRKNEEKAAKVTNVDAKHHE